MEKSYFILTKNLKDFSYGYIFEKGNQEQLLCLDSSITCKSIKDILDFCETIDRKSAFLLMAVEAKNRIRVFKDSLWNQTSQLDVGDECIHLLKVNEAGCTILSKHLDKGGIVFTLVVEDGSKINATIEKLKPLAISLPKENVVANLLTNEKNRNNSMRKENPVTNETNKNCAVKNIFSTLEQFTKSVDLGRRRDTVAVARGIGKTISYFENESNYSTDIQMKQLFEKAENLDIFLEEKERFFNNLVMVLPNILEDEEGRCSLHWAAHYLLIDPVKSLITNEDFKNKIDFRGNTPMHLAVSCRLTKSKEFLFKRNQFSIIRIFLLNQADINIKNKLNDTVLTLAFKNGNFEVLENILENSTTKIILSNHCLTENISILECLIKLEKYSLSSTCCKLSEDSKNENSILLKAAFHAVVKKNRGLVLDILEKCKDINAILSDDETFLTKIFKESLIGSETICSIINSASFDYSKQNKLEEYPLLLACRRLMLEPFKYIFNKVTLHISQLNDCLDETIKAYTSLSICNKYKNVKPMSQISITQIKPIVYEISELLIKNGANIDSTNLTIQETIDTCLDQDFAKVIKHLCRQKSNTRKNVDISLGNKNECSICMDRPIDCSFLCGHTYCSICSENLFECPSCREPVTEKRKIFI